MRTASPLYKGASRWLLAAVFVALVGGVVVLHAVRTLRPADDASQAVFGTDPSALGRSLYEAPRGLAARLSPAQRAELRRQIARYPMEGNLIALAALDAEATGNTALAKTLSHHALRIEPRTRLAWLARLSRQLLERRNVDAANSVLRLLAVDPVRYAAYIPILAQLTRDRRTIGTIGAALAENPPWRSPLLDLMSAQKYDPAIAYALMNSNSAARTGTIANEDTAFVNNLVNTGDIDRAYLAWLSFLPENALPDTGVPYDSTFRGLPGPAPFNWSMMAAGGDRATIGNGMLNVSYAGRQASDLAAQVLLLPAGSYRLVTTFATVDQDGAPGSGTALLWRLICLPARTSLAEAHLDPAVSGRGQASAVFTVPAIGCPAVSLTLAGSASEFPSRLNAAIASVVVQPASQAAVAAPSPTPSPTSTSLISQ